MRHRTEIDGLRAISVLPVILFHAGFSGFHGGFIGVDIFFVISGYLITTLIQEDRERGRFSIVDFYERRARRILPALSLVMLACLPVAWWMMNASDFINFSQSMAAVALFSSGLLYIFTAGYFDTSSELKPLLHTWSLGVEEQFYLFFPLILMLLGMLGSWALRIGVLALIVGSLWLAEWGIVNFPTSTFYFMPTRAWELMIGAFLALNQARLNQLPQRACELLSALGMGMIVVAAVLYDHSTPFPGIYALLPTVGAALVIGFGNSTTWIGRFLSLRALVMIGLISYSAYLWHQPLFAFTRLAYDKQAPDPMVMLGMSVLTLALAYATWRWVETPFRSRQKMSRAQIFAFSGAVTAGFISLGAAGHFHVMTTRWEQQNPHLVNFSPVSNQPERRSCNHLIQDVGGHTDCVQIGDGSKTLVMWGDSHAKAMRAGTPRLPDTRILVLAHSGCAPLPGLRRFDLSDGAHACDTFDVVEDTAKVIASLKPDTVVLASRWMLYLQGWVFEGRKMAQHFMMSDGQDEQVLASREYREDMIRRHMQAVIDRLSPHSQVLIMSQLPDLANYVFRDVEYSDMRIQRAEVEQWHAPESAVLSKLQLPPNARIFDLKALFCNDEACPTRMDGTLIYRDDNHLSPFGATKVWQALGEYTAANVRSAALSDQSAVQR